LASARRASLTACTLRPAGIERMRLVAVAECCPRICIQRGINLLNAIRSRPLGFSARLFQCAPCPAEERPEIRRHISEIRISATSPVVARSGGSTLCCAGGSKMLPDSAKIWGDSAAWTARMATELPSTQDDTAIISARAMGRDSVEMHCCRIPGQVPFATNTRRRNGIYDCRALIG
jgi:hypothetical protein